MVPLLKQTLLPRTRKHQMEGRVYINGLAFIATGIPHHDYSTSILLMLKLLTFEETQ